MIETALTPEQERIVLALQSNQSYEDIQTMTEGAAWPYSYWSRGRVYGLACRLGARKTERRIQERSAERKQRQLESFKDLLNSTATSDVLDFLEGIPDQSIAAHITSIPYNVGKPYGGVPGADRMAHLYYLGWMLQIISGLARTIKEGGTIVLQCGSTKDDDGNTFPLDELLSPYLRRAGLTYQNRIVWPSQNGLTPANRLSERYEVALVYSRGRPLFNANAIRTPQKNPGKRAYKGPNRGELSGHQLGAWPSDIFNINHLMANHPEKTAHPAQFPVALPKRAILAYTNPDGVVCDIFNGSGSTQIAAIETGRPFVGADLYYEDIRAERLAKAKPDTFSPFSGVTEESMAIWSAEARRVDIPATPRTAREDTQQILDLFSSDEASAA